MPPGHPILKAEPLTLEAIAKYPIATYDFAFTGRSQINRAFAARGLAPNVVLTAIDADIIKTYVGLGLGLGLGIGIRRHAWLRSYVYTFIELFAPHLTRRVVQSALAGEEGSDSGL